MEPGILLLAAVTAADLPPKLHCVAEQTAGLHDYPHNEQTYEPVVFVESAFKLEVNEALTAYENRLIDEQATVADTAETLFDAGEDELAISYLTGYSRDRGLEGLRLGNALLASIEARTELIYGYRAPETDVISAYPGSRVNCLPKD